MDRVSLVPSHRSHWLVCTAPPYLPLISIPDVRYGGNLRPWELGQRMEPNEIDASQKCIGGDLRGISISISVKQKEGCWLWVAHAAGCGYRIALHGHLCVKSNPTHHDAMKLFPTHDSVHENFNRSKSLCTALIATPRRVTWADLSPPLHSIATPSFRCIRIITRKHQTRRVCHQALDSLQECQRRLFCRA